MKSTQQVRERASRRPALPGWREGVSAMALTAMLASAPVFAQDNTDEADGEDTEIIQVTGYRSSLQTSQTIKRDSEVVVDSITAEDIGALPDRSVTEALQRVPGVSIDRFRAGVDPDHFSIEGSGVVVRGLTWVRSELNGRDTFSANNGRVLSFSDVPSELMGGVDVFKSPSADMIEGGISGTINLRTRRPFDGSPTLAASVEASYGDFAEEWTPTYSIMASNRWDTGNGGEWGLLFNYVNSELTARSDGQQISNYGERTLYTNGDVVPGAGDTAVGTVWFPRGAAFRSQIFDRTREGIGAAAQWRSEDRTMEATLQYLRSDSQQAWTEHAMEIATDNVAGNGDSQAVDGTTLDFGPSGLFTGGIITSDNTGWRSDQFNGDNRTPAHGLQSNNIRRDVLQDYVTEDIGFNFRWTPNDSWSFNFDFQHVESTVDVTDIGLWASTYQNAAIALNGDSIPWVIFQPPGLDGTPCAGNPGTQNCPAYYRTGHDSFSDPFNSFPRAAMDHIEQSEGTLDAFRADGEYHFNNPDRWAESIRFGYRHSNRDQTTRFSTYNWGVISEQWGNGGPVWLDSAMPGGGGQLSDYFTTFSFDNFMRGQVPVPTGDEPRLFWGSNIIQNYQQMEDFAVGVGSAWRPTTTCENWEPLAARCGQFEPGTPFLLQEVNPIQETNDSLYAMLRFDQEMDNGVHVSGNFGLRYVNMTRETQGYHSFTNVTFSSEADCAAVPAGQQPPDFCLLSLSERDAARAFADGSITPNTTSHDMEYYLPSFNAVARLENGWQFRLGVSKTITMPDVGLTRNFYNITLQAPIFDNNGVRVLDPTINSTVGNPYLDPIESMNFDASAEWYFASVGSLTFALFYKQLDNVITNGTERLTFTNNGATFSGVVTTPSNSPEQGTVKGFELAYQQTYDFLPGIWSGLGMNASYTYVDSEGVVQSTLSATDPDVAAGRVANIDTSLLPLQGLSEHTVNVAGFYENDWMSLRLAYAWRSDFVVTVRDVIVPFAPIIQESGGQLDGSAFFSVNDNIRVGVQGVNLLNQVTRTSQVLNNDLLTAPRSWFMNDRRVTFIIRATY